MKQALQVCAYYAGQAALVLLYVALLGACLWAFVDFITRHAGLK